MHFTLPLRLCFGGEWKAAIATLFITWLAVVFTRLYLARMKQQLAAIAFNERELEAYVSQLQTQNFESVSDVKKAEDGTFYRVMAKAVRHEAPIAKPAVLPEENLAVDTVVQPA